MYRRKLIFTKSIKQWEQVHLKKMRGRELSSAKPSLLTPCLENLTTSSFNSQNRYESHTSKRRFQSPNFTDYSKDRLQKNRFTFHIRHSVQWITVHCQEALKVLHQDHCKDPGLWQSPSSTSSLENEVWKGHYLLTMCCNSNRLRPPCFKVPVMPHKQSIYVSLSQQNLFTM